MTASSRFLILLIGMLGGVIAATYHPANFLAAACLSSLSYAFLRGQKFLACLLCCLAGFGWGGAYTHWWRQRYHQEYRYGKMADFTAQIVAPPDLRAEKTFLTVKPLPGGLPENSGRGSLLIKVPRHPMLAYGDLITVSGLIEAPEPFNGFNYPLYLERYHIQAIIQEAKVKKIRSGAGSPLLARLYALRGQAESAIQSALPEPESSFLAGILLGSKRAIPEDVQENLRATGTSHIIAISGANITILLGMLLAALPLLRLNQQFAAVCAVGTFICLLTGASASVVRGAVMASYSTYLKTVSRRAWPLPFILSSMALMLAINPLLLCADPGFQLSFAAFAGLSAFKARIDWCLARLPGVRSLPEIILGSFSETLAATLGTLPLSLSMFGQVSAIGLLVNPLILWLIPATSFMGLALLIIAPFKLPALPLAMPLWLFLHGILEAISWFSRFESSALIKVPNHG